LVAEAGHFFGVYSVGDSLDARTHELTPSRDTIEEVVADLLKAQARRRIIRFARIVSTSTLHSIEPVDVTIERLRQRDRSGARSRRTSALSNSVGSEASGVSQSVGYLVLAMTVICVGTVVGVLLVQ
jgi:hypothetical protein